MFHVQQIIWFFLFQDITENSPDAVVDLHMSFEELYTQKLLQRHDENLPSVELSLAPTSGFPINDYTPVHSLEQYECENTGAWTESNLPNEVISNSEFAASLLPDLSGKVIL